MTTAEMFDRPHAEPAPLRLAGLAVALWAATWAVDWTEVFKVLVVTGASLSVVIDSGRRLTRGPEATR